MNVCEVEPTFRLTCFHFKGKDAPIAKEGSDIYEVVEKKIIESRGELAHLEEAVKEQMSSKPKKKKKASPKASGSSSTSGTNMGAAAAVALSQLDFNLSDSD
jgi:hypothetical protein